MKSLFYGGAIASVAGLVLGMGMQVPAEQPAVGADAQPVADLVAYDAPQATAYGSPAEAYPPSYVINAAYAGEPVTQLRDEPVFDEPVADQVIKASWQEPAETPKATPQDIAAAGDTTTPTDLPSTDDSVRTYASIDAVLNQQQVAPQPVHGPS